MSFVFWFSPGLQEWHDLDLRHGGQHLHVSLELPQSTGAARRAPRETIHVTSSDSTSLLTILGPSGPETNGEITVRRILDRP